jgi:hypothetical protein
MKHARQITLTDPEWIKFLRQIDEETPSDLDLHVIVDNYAMHKHPRVKS